MSSLIPAPGPARSEAGAGTDGWSRCPRAWFDHGRDAVGRHTRPVREHFLLDPDVVFLNHGSFGACPQPVFEAYQAWQRELEREPVQFIARRLEGLLEHARAELAAFVGAAPDDLTFVQNATTGVNMAARALDLSQATRSSRPTSSTARATSPGSTSAHERVRATSARRSTRSSSTAPSARARCSSRTSRPRRRCCCRSKRSSRRRGCTARHDRRRCPRGCAGRPRPRGPRRGLLLRQLPQVAVRAERRRVPLRAPEWQERVDGTIVSWGYGEPATFISRTERQGTRDPAAYLAVPDAIAFHRAHDVRDRCVELAREARHDLCACSAPSRSRPTRRSSRWRACACRSRSPSLSQRLFDDHRIEIPTTGADDALLRISIASYTEREDVERLLDALPVALRTSRSPA